VALLCVMAGLAYAITLSLWGVIVVGAIEAAFWAFTQIFEGQAISP